MSALYIVEFERKASVCEDSYNSVVGVYSTWALAVQAYKIIKASHHFDNDTDGFFISHPELDIMPKDDYLNHK